MLLCISVPETDYLEMNDGEKLDMLRQAYRGALNLRYKAELLDERTRLVRSMDVLNEYQKMFVDALYMGLLD